MAQPAAEVRNRAAPGRDEIMAAALIDRLVHHCHIVNIRGNSYRLRQHTELVRQLHRTAGTDRRPHRQEATRSD